VGAEQGEDRAGVPEVRYCCFGGESLEFEEEGGGLVVGEGDKMGFLLR
jgi:hypothetical protein